MKTCTKCKQLLSLDCFANNKSKKDGKSKWCKQCTNEFCKKYYEENKEKLHARHKKYRKENKEKIITYKKKYGEENKEKMNAYNRKYYEENEEKVNSRNRKYNKRDSKSLSDTYLRRLLAQRNSLSRKEVPNELIQAKREEIKIKRLIKEMEK